MLHVSIITACIPSIKRFLDDVQSGLMGATISEHYELTHTGGKSSQVQSGSGTGLGSKLASRLGVKSQSTSRAEKSQMESSSQEETFGNVAYARQSRSKPQADESESVKGLAQNVIHQKIDYDIEYEDRGHAGKEADGRRAYNTYRSSSEGP